MYGSKVGLIHTCVYTHIHVYVNAYLHMYDTQLS